jgi:uncharacterized protein
MTERLVPCPTCRTPAPFSERNPWRPFCSGRCRSVDLGAWASEGYRVDAEPATDVDAPPSSTASPH